MNSGRAGRRGEPSGSRGATPTPGPARKPRKKPKTPAEPEPRTIGPIPAPYLALAPSPVSSLSPSALDELSSQLVLPSSYLRSGTPLTPPLGSSSNIHAGPSRQRGGARGGYAAGLLAPPTILPGGTASTPRIQPLPGGVQMQLQAPQNPRYRSADRTRPLTSRRSEDRLRDLTILNASLSSLGQLGHILESGRLPEDTVPPLPGDTDGTAQNGGAGPAQRRRRRIVRGENGGLARRPTVSSREEGRALGLARGASMRRTNVWDDIPEAGEPPPPFPFPTPSSNRLPPTFSANPTSPSRSEVPPNPNVIAASTPVPTSAASRPRSPPPSFEIALGLAPSSFPSSDVLVRDSSPHSSGAPTPRARPTLTLSTTAPGPLSGAEFVNQPSSASQSPISPASTHYVSAPASPSRTILSVDDNLHLTEDERADRKMWNADLLAGYTLEERVHRELARKRAREQLIAATGEAGSLNATAALPSGYTAGTVELRDPELSQDNALELTSHGGIVSTSGHSNSQDENLSTDSVNPTNLAELDIPFADDVVVAVQTDTGPPVASTESIVEEENFPIIAPEPPGESFVVNLTDDNPVSPVATQAQAAPECLSTLPAAAIPEVAATASASEPLPPSTTADVEETAVSSSRLPPTPTSSHLEAVPVPVTSAKLMKETVSTPDKTPAVQPKSLPLDEEQIIPSPGPVRKLTRGKAIRRRSSDLISSPRSPRSPKSPLLTTGKRHSEGDISPVVKPLFAGAGYRVGGLSPSPETLTTAKVADPLPVPKEDEREEIGDFIANAAQDHLRFSQTQIPQTQLPPNREAALRRRLQLQPRQPAPVSASTKNRAARRASLSRPLSGPLIDFNTDFSVPDFTLPDLPVLSPSAVDLLQLQLHEDQPIAESSAQAAARAAELSIQHAHVVEAQRHHHSPPQADSNRKIPPTPPPSRAARLGSQIHSGNSTPRAQSPQNAHPEITPTAPALPSRRPAPPPPSSSDSVNQRSAPPLPPRPPLSTIEQLFRPSTDRTDSTSSMETVVPSKPTSPPIARPRGPRPPPPPPRQRKTWSKVVSQYADPPIPSPIKSALVEDLPKSPASSIRARPLAERTQSENPTLTQASPIEEIERIHEQRERGVNRSASEVDLRRGGREAEYTDLDLLVSRIEGSGREFEGFTQITSFLGPSKIPSATPEALATLLPGFISIDSRRTTPQGKVKLKLSLLGVRVTKCPICLSQFKSGEKGVLVPPCGHAGHESCALRWFREDGRCFVCREVLGE